MATSSAFGWTAKTVSVRVTAPSTARPGTYQVQVSGTNWGRTKSTTVNVQVAADLPTAKAPSVAILSGSVLGRSSTGTDSVTLRPAWAAATDPSDPIVGYEVERSVERQRVWLHASRQQARPGPSPSPVSDRHVVPVPCPGTGQGRLVEPMGRRTGRDPRRGERPVHARHLSRNVDPVRPQPLDQWLDHDLAAGRALPLGCGSPAGASRSSR